MTNSQLKRAFALLALVSSLTGCGAQIGVLEPTQVVAPNATRLDLLVSTTRAPAQDRGVLFSGERGATSNAAMVVSIPPDDVRQVGQVQWPRQVPPNPATEFALLDVKPLAGQSQTRAWIHAHAAKSRRVLVFVHGFNTTFERALIWFAQIAHDADADAAPVLFSWPSRGSIFDYAYDRESANFSRDAFERLLREIVADPSVGEVTLLAHSMGAWLATETLRQMAIKDNSIHPKIRNVILASPDLDVDVFRVQLQRFGTPRPNFTVFVSRRDRALRLSRRIAGNVERLGVVDPAAKPWLSAEGIDVIDLTGAPNTSWSRHAKFAQNPDVVRFLGAQLVNNSSEGAPPGFGERMQSISMGVTKGVGGAAGLVLGAPIAIVSPQARRAYVTQFDQVQQAVESVGDLDPTD
jgi:esterase/lipase superfamily enzyme